MLTLHGIIILRGIEKEATRQVYGVWHKTKAGGQGKTICVNFFAGAGAGKSTMATTLHSILKMHNINSEYTGEYAKDLAWEGRLALRKNGLKIFAEQHNKQFRLYGQVDCIISDSPLLLTIVYRESMDTLLNALALQEFRKYDNLNFYVTRVKPYIPKGRKETAKGASKIDVKVLDMLKNEQIPFEEVEGTAEGANHVIVIVLKKLNVSQKYKVCRT